MNTLAPSRCIRMRCDILKTNLTAIPAIASSNLPRKLSMSHVCLMENGECRDCSDTRHDSRTRMGMGFFWWFNHCSRCLCAVFTSKSPVQAPHSAPYGACIKKTLRTGLLIISLVKQTRMAAPPLNALPPKVQ